MILFVDDEPEYISAYIQAFELGDFEVKVLSSIEEASGCVRTQLSQIQAVILDVMMPPESVFSLEDTKGGLRTGLVFLEQMKALDEGIPVIILTNAHKADFGEVPHRNCEIYEKKEIGPWELLDRMSEMKRKVKFDD